MVKINYDLLPYKHTRKKSTGAVAKHNAFYIPETDTGSTLYRDYHTYDYFGLNSDDPITDDSIGKNDSTKQVKGKTLSKSKTLRKEK